MMSSLFHVPNGFVAQDIRQMAGELELETVYMVRECLVNATSIFRLTNKVQWQW